MIMIVNRPPLEADGNCKSNISDNNLKYNRKGAGAVFSNVQKARCALEYRRSRARIDGHWVLTGEPKEASIIGQKVPVRQHGPVSVNNGTSYPGGYEVQVQKLCPTHGYISYIRVALKEGY